MKKLLLFNRYIRVVGPNNIYCRVYRCFSESKTRKEAIKEMKENGDLTNLLKLLKYSNDPEEKVIYSKALLEIQDKFLYGSQSHYKKDVELLFSYKEKEASKSKVFTEYTKKFFDLKFKILNLLLPFAIHTMSSRKIISKIIKDSYSKSVDNFNILYLLLILFFLGLSFDNLSGNIGK